MEYTSLRDICYNITLSILPALKKDLEHFWASLLLQLTSTATIIKKKEEEGNNVQEMSKLKNYFILVASKQAGLVI